MTDARNAVVHRSTLLPSNEIFEEDKMFIIKLINEYERLPILWDECHENKQKKQPTIEAWQQLLNSFQKKYKDANINDLKSFIKNLRHSYHRERRRLQLLNNKSADGGYEHHQSRLYYFKEFEFLNSNLGVYEKRSLKRNKSNESDDNLQKPPKKKKKRQDNHSPEDASKSLLENNGRGDNELSEDRFETFRSLIVADMRNMKPEQELIFRELVIKLSSLGLQNKLERDKNLLLNAVKAVYFT